MCVQAIFKLEACWEIEVAFLLARKKNSLTKTLYIAVFLSAVKHKESEQKQYSIISLVSEDAYERML